MEVKSAPAAITSAGGVAVHVALPFVERVANGGVGIVPAPLDAAAAGPPA